MDFQIVKIKHVHGKGENRLTEMKKSKFILSCHRLEITTLMNLVCILPSCLRDILSCCMNTAAYYLFHDISSMYISAYRSIFVELSHSFKRVLEILSCKYH